MSRFTLDPFAEHVPTREQARLEVLALLHARIAFSAPSVALSENRTRLVMLAWRYLGETRQQWRDGDSFEHGASAYVGDVSSWLGDLSKASLGFLLFVAEDLKTEAYVRRELMI